MHLLRTTTLSLAAVAQAAGFSEASSFFRAFRKWTGVNPGAYRGQIKRRKDPRVVGRRRLPRRAGERGSRWPARRAAPYRMVPLTPFGKKPVGVPLAFR